MSGFFDTWGSEGASERAKEKEKQGSKYVEKPISMVGGKVLSDEEADERYKKGGATAAELAKVQKRRAEAAKKGYASTSEMAYAEREDAPSRTLPTGLKNTTPSGSSQMKYTASGSSSSGKPSGGLTDNPAFTPGSTIDLSGLKNAIGSKPQSVLDMNGYKDWIDKIANAGGADVAVDPARFQSTEHLANLFKQMQDMLAPQTQAQKDAANSAYGSAANQLDNKWASRGLLASGAAAAQQQQGANSLAQQMAGIEANQQANAMNLGLNYADLGLRESDQRFNQQQSNRQFDLSRATSGAGAYMGGLNFQEQQLQNYLGNLKDVTGMEMNQNQWSQEFGLNRQNADFNRWLGSSNFYEGQRQFNENMDQRQYEYDTNMDQRRYEYDSGLDLDRDRFDFDKEKYAGDNDYRNRQLDYDYYTYDNDLAFDKQKYATDQTGRYMPDNAQGLLSQLGSLKKDAMNPANAGKMAQYKAQGDDIRNQLELMGIDTSKLGSNVSVSDYYRNAGQAGIQTQANKEWEYGKTRDAEDDRRWGLDYELRKQQQGNNNRTTTDNISQNQYNREQSDYKKKAAQETTKYAMELLGKTQTYEEALGFLGGKAAELSSMGVDVGPLWDSIQAKFPKVAGTTQETPLQKAQREKIEAEIRKMDADREWQNWLMQENGGNGSGG